jgi:hypothetical protein
MKEDSSMDRLLRESIELRAARPPRGPCLDAETLAAWADGALSARDRSVVEAHAADCARCQSLLALMVRTAPASPERSIWRALRLRWVVPLAAAAAGVAVWVLVPDRTPVAPANKPTDQVTDAFAQRPPAAAPIPSRESDEKRLAAPAERERSAQAEEARRDEAVQPKLEEAQRNEAPSAPASETLTRAAQLDKRALADAAALIVTSPDPQVVWRALPDRGAIQRSADGGQTWQPQTVAAADVPVTAGSSPTPEICWMVGARGTVVVTTDGTTWRRTSFPDSSVNLIAVDAVDDKNATVTASNGRRYRTSDGGLTWNEQPPQEIPASPF